MDKTPTIVRGLASTYCTVQGFEIRKTSLNWGLKEDRHHAFRCDHKNSSFWSD